MIIETSEIDNLLLLGKYNEAYPQYKALLEKHGDVPILRAKAAVCMAGLNEYEQADEQIRWAVAQEPDCGEIHYMRGGILGGLHKPHEALMETNTALSLLPYHAPAMWNKGLYELGIGNYKEGWRYYRTGKTYGYRPNRTNIFPEGTPQDWYGKTVLIWTEQGIGDIFMFARYLRYMKQILKVGTIIFEVHGHDALPMFFDSPYVDFLYRGHSCLAMPYNEVDFVVGLLDIPYFLSHCCDIHTVIPPMPNDLAPTSSIIEPAKEYINGLSKKFKIGVCWKGSPGHVNDINRSSSFEEFVKPLLGLPKVQVFGLQYGDETQEKGYHNLGMELANWAITAGYAQAMDLIITVDTALAHLTATLGIPTMVVCPFANEWRWGYKLSRQGFKSPWYNDNLMVYRQTERRKWESVIPKVIEDAIRKYSLA